ncbi:MAG: hypothetical protein AAF732_22735 [Pseudomonadota bacterium]
MAALAKAARENGIPLVSCCAGRPSEKDVQPLKVKALDLEFFVGSPALEIDLNVLDEDSNFTLMT